MEGNLMNRLPVELRVTEAAEHCPRCGEVSARMVEYFGITRRVAVQCRCRLQEEHEKLQQKQREEFDQRLARRQSADRISDLSHKACLFEQDDQMDEDCFAICTKYVLQWEEMKANNMGILFYGTVGSGKTYRAGCIVNALTAGQVTATVTSFPRLLNLMQDCGDRQGILDSLNWYECLVIDDLGAERDSAYALEQVYHIIDSRGKSGKPLIITTNLTLQELKNPKDLDHARIYDRVLELCPITLKMTGDSRRAEKAKRKRELARKLLTAG